MKKISYNPYIRFIEPATMAAIAAGTAVANAAANTGSTMLARKQNYKYNEKLAQNTYARQRELYKDFYSPEAMIEQYKRAGLSPSLMYAQGGTIGQTTAQAPQGTGVQQQAPYIPIDNIADNMLKMAQAKNIEEDTKGKKIDNEVKDEFAAAQAAAELSVTLNEAGLKEASIKATELQNIMQFMQNENYAEFGRDKMMYDTYRLKIGVADLYEQLQQNRYKTQFDSRTLETRIQATAEELKNIIANNALIIAQRHLTEANTETSRAQAEKFSMEVEEIGNRIAQKWTELGIYEKTQEQQQNWLREQAQLAIAEAAKANAEGEYYKKKAGVVEYEAKTERIDTIWKNVNGSVKEAREVADLVCGYVFTLGLNRMGRTETTTYTRGREHYMDEQGQMRQRDTWNKDKVVITEKK